MKGKGKVVEMMQSVNVTLSEWEWKCVLDTLQYSSERARLLPRYNRVEDTQQCVSRRVIWTVD